MFAAEQNENEAVTPTLIWGFWKTYLSVWQQIYLSDQYESYEITGYNLSFVYKYVFLYFFYLIKYFIFGACAAQKSLFFEDFKARLRCKLSNMLRASW